MTAHPVAVAALRLAACPWSLGFDGEGPVCAPAATDGYKRVVPAADQQSEAQRLNGRSE